MPCPTRSANKLLCLSPILGKSLGRIENFVPSLPPLSFLRKQVSLLFLGFFSPLFLRVSCWQLIFIMQQVISLWNSLLQDVSLAFRVDCVIAWTDGARKVMTIPVKNSGEEMLQAAFWLFGLCGGYSYRAGYPQTAALDMTFVSQDAGWDSGLSAWPCLNISVTLYTVWHQHSCLLTRLPQRQARRPSFGFHKTHLILRIWVYPE